MKSSPSSLSQPRLIILPGKGIWHWDFQEICSQMGCYLWSAIWGGWKAQVPPPSRVYAHGLQATRHPTSRCIKELYYDNGQGYCWGYQKDGQGTNVIPVIAAIPNTCVLGTQFEHEPISQCMDFKQWPCILGHCCALDQWWLEAQYTIFLILDACLLTISTMSEELLIDFHELVGEHSGENLAHAIYDTLNLYGLKGWVSLWVVPGFCTLSLTTRRLLPSMQTMPRTTTPWLNTWRHCCRGILLSLVHRMSGCGACLIQFIWQCWRYFVVRLMNSICNLIEFIHSAFESNWCSQMDGLEEDIATVKASLSEVLAAIPKVYFVFGLHVLDSELICARLRNIIQAVCSSPQQWEAWLEEANAFLQKAAAALSLCKSEKSSTKSS